MAGNLVHFDERTTFFEVDKWIIYNFSKIF